MRTGKAQRRAAQRRKKARARVAGTMRPRQEEVEQLASGPRLPDEALESPLKQGRFYPELTLGAGALSGGRRAELQRFMVAVVRQRGGALHVGNLWNALYFNYDLTNRGFRLDSLEQKRIPKRTARERDWSLPVGAFVRVHTDAQCGDLLGEVTYKEGAHSSLEDDWADPRLSGAPATDFVGVAGQTVAVVRERFVLDLNAFGAGANDITPKQYERLLRRAKWLDEHGHLVIEAMYPHEQAELEDLDYYAEYLLREHRDGLLAFCFQRDMSDQELREALLRSFEAVRQLAATAPQLRGWLDKYFFLASAFEERLADDGALGEGDLSSLFRGIARVSDDEQRCYSPIRPRILELLKRDGLEKDEAALVQDCAYTTAICFANCYIADALARDQRDGLLATSVHVRLDDDWQAGGIWRAERPTDPEHYSLKTVPPTLPLGLGYAQTQPGPDDDQRKDDTQPLGSSQTGFRVPLTLRDRELGRARLSATAADALAPGPVDFVLRHNGERARFQVEREGKALYGIEYPWDFHPGLILACNVESGGSVVRARTLPVTPPIAASDGTSFDYETSLSVYEREMGLEQLPEGEKQRALTLNDLIHRAFRLRGRVRDDGSRTMTLAQLATVILGPAWSALETGPIVTTLAAMGLERDGAEYVWRPRVGRRTRSTDRTLLAAYGEGEASRDFSCAVRKRWVPMHLRRYVKRKPSLEKQRTYAEARKRYGMHGVLPEELPPGCSWVEPYSWGDDPESAHEEQPTVRDRSQYQLDRRDLTNTSRGAGTRTATPARARPSS